MTIKLLKSKKTVKHTTNVPTSMDDSTFPYHRLSPVRVTLQQPPSNSLRPQTSDTCNFYSPTLGCGLISTIHSNLFFSPSILRDFLVSNMHIYMIKAGTVVLINALFTG
jgi:hypothetical protein